MDAGLRFVVSSAFFLKLNLDVNLDVCLVLLLVSSMFVLLSGFVPKL